MPTFTVTYDTKRLNDKQIFIQTKTEKYKSFKDAFDRAKFIKISGISANVPLIEER